MTGAGRSGGRGAAVAAARTPRSVPAHPLILPFRLASVLAAQLFDFATFTVMVGRHGIISEANPLVALGFAGYGMLMLALLKVALVVLLASTIVVVDRDRVVRRSALDIAALITVVAVAGGLVGGISNVIAS